MLPRALALLAVLFPAGDTEDAFQVPVSFHINQITSFANSTWVKYQASGWLGDVQIHYWDNDLATATFLKPWSKGNFSDEEVSEVVELFQVYAFAFVREMTAHVKALQIQYPVEFQGIGGCELRAGGAIVSFLRGALGGLNFASFQNSSCVPAPEGGSAAQKVCSLLAPYRDIYYVVEKLLYETCPRYLLGVLEAGKADLQRQVKPEAWLSSDPSPGPGRVQLVCHVSGFHPKPVWVMWMRGEQELPETRREDILPNADDTWYLRVTLDVAEQEASGLCCRVKHSSLRGQDIVLHWGRSNSIGWVVLAIIVSCLVSFLCFMLWRFRHLSYMDIP